MLKERDSHEATKKMQKGSPSERSRWAFMLSFDNAGFQKKRHNDSLLLKRGGLFGVSQLLELSDLPRSHTKW